MKPYINGLNKKNSCSTWPSASNEQQRYRYEYDSLGRVICSQEITNGALHQGTETLYDDANRVKKQSWSLFQTEDGKTTTKTYTGRYTYSTGNGTMSTADFGTGRTATFAYDNLQRLTSVTVNGTTRSITYEENGVTIGNSLSYYNGTQYTLAWQNGRQLASLSGGGKSATYTYGADGIRTGKTVTDASGTTTYQYTTQNGQIARQSWTAGGTAYQMDFIYDAAGRPLAMYYRTKTASQTDFNGDSYYYETNQQGDVTGLYKITYNANTKSLTATRVASYEYDAWGNVTYSTGTMAKINPLKYRGYYHDAESGFYYLQSRYYDPAIGRFVQCGRPDIPGWVLPEYESVCVLWE